MDLLTRVEKTMKGFDGFYSLYAEDQSGKFLELNSDEVMETASCIKVPVLLELFKRVSKKEIDLTDLMEYKEEDFTVGSGILQHLSLGISLPIKDIALLMIIVSDNAATNMLIDYLGQDNINQTMEELALPQTRLLNKIKFEENKEVIIGQTTAAEYIKMFKLIKNNVFDESSSQMMLDILQRQNYNQMLTRNLPLDLTHPSKAGGEPLIKVASKSGSLKYCRNDGGIFLTPWGHFYLAIFTKDFSDWYFHADQTAVKYASKVSNLILNHFISCGGSF